MRQLAEGFNCPRSSAVGRYFDAAAALLGLADCNHHEAQAPMALEAAIAPACERVLPYRIAEAAGDQPMEIDLRPAVLELIGRLDADEPVGELAAAFHNTMAAALAETAARAAKAAGLDTVALSGGVFANRYLSMRMAELLVMDYELKLMAHRRVPPNDGGLALGQAAVAAARMAGIKSKVA
ncbi:MAG: Carbamoyltransferase HypF [Phycisphaerae bacterium]|nr:Carbamoyltransferase HypF [Phycisphaerae bacterium]